MRHTTLPILLASLLLTACATQPPATDDSLAVSALPPTEPSEERASERITRPFPAESFYDLLVGEFAIRYQRYDIALEHYLRQAHQTRDRGVAAHATRLAQYIQADKATLNAAMLWVELEPDNVEARYSLAAMLARLHQPKLAMPHMIEVLKGGGHPNFAMLSAAALNHPEAVQQELASQLQQLLGEYPDNPQVLTGLAVIQQQLGQLEEALANAQHTLTLQPANLHAMIVEARVLQELGRLEEADQKLSQAVEEHPTSRRLRLQYARLLTQTDIASAREQFEILINQYPNDADLLLTLGLINQEVGDLEPARENLKQLLQLNQHVSQAHLYLGMIDEQQGALASAVDHYLAIPPSNELFPALERALQLLTTLDRLDDAREHLAKLRIQLPEQAVRLFVIESELLIQQRQLNESRELLSEALQSHPEHPSLLYSRAMLSEQLGDIPSMEQDLLHILQRDPDNAAVLNALGYTLLEQPSRLEDAYTLILRAYQLKPEEPAIIDSMGWAEYRRGNLQSALTLLKQAYRALPDPEVAAHLGEILWQLGEQTAAQEIWRESLRHHPRSAILRETMLRLQGEIVTP